MEGDDPMSGSLNDVLPKPISEESEEIIIELLKRKMKGAASLAVRLLHAMEERFGTEAREVLADMIAEQRTTPRPGAGDPQEDLQEFCASLERGCVGSHQWERVVDEPDRIGYHFTRCMWAEVFCELGEPELGFAFCASDEPAVRSFNPHLGFERTKVLMNGDEYCDHVFLVTGEQGS